MIDILLIFGKVFAYVFGVGLALMLLLLVMVLIMRLASDEPKKEEEPKHASHPVKWDTNE